MNAPLDTMETLARQALGPRARVVVTVTLGAERRCSVVAGVAFDDVHVEAASLDEAVDRARTVLRELAVKRLGDAALWGDR